MADYSSGPSRDYGSSPYQRDAAFSQIFGQRPPGHDVPRAQTMNSTSHFPPPERGDTMSADMMNRGMPPVRQHQANGVVSQQSQSPDGHNGSRVYQHGQGPPPPPAQRQPQPGYLPQPIRPDRRPYGVPQRVDSRNPAMGQQYNQAAQRRFPSGGPALNTDSYRSQSLMSSSSRPSFTSGAGAPGGYNPPPAHTFRQQQYVNHMARTTAQGRVVPERQDERTMSMTSYNRDNEFTQTMSGRVIPNRRREEADHEALTALPQARPSPGQHHPTPISPASSKTRTPSQSSVQSRSMSMASTVVASERTETMNTHASKPSVSKTNSIPPQNALMVSQRKAPLVYPALLSKVAQTFQDRIGLSEKQKDALDYKNAFSGAEAVDLIAYIIKTTDRNLALLLGRSLDAQKFFHDVTYAHRLRDSHSEIYQFKETVEDTAPEVNGVFTLLTDCYSPTCTRDRLCYSIACPRRLEQQARLNLKPQPGLKKQDSRTSLHEDQNDEQKLWINTVPKEIADSVDDKEKKRQEVISELMYTERDFVKDLEYLRECWIRPLRTPGISPIPEHRREKFVREVFSNIQDIHAVNSRLAEALTRRQQAHPVVKNVGDIFRDFVPKFNPFIKYGGNQIFGKFEVDNEKKSNPNFARFVDQVERMKESRKLELNGYLTKPTTRLARYPLLLENVHKYTKDDNPDKEDIPKAIVLIRDFLMRVNKESGRAENIHTLLELNRNLRWRPGEFVDLKLTDDARQLIHKAQLKKSPQDTTADMQVFLFDHAVLITRKKEGTNLKDKVKEEVKVYKKPIPLELLVIMQMEDVLPKMSLVKRPSTNLAGASRTNTMSSSKMESMKIQGWPITFKHLGKGGFEHTVYCASAIQQQKFLELVEQQQRTLRERSSIYTKTIVNDNYFSSSIRVNCAVPTDGGRKMVLGTDNGVYVYDRKSKDANNKPKRVLDHKLVTQIDVLEQHQILLVLADKHMWSYPIDVLDSDDGQAAKSKRGHKMCGANFFKAGVCMGQHLVCCGKVSSLTSTIRVYEPMDTMTKNKKKSGLAKMLVGGQEALKPLKVLNTLSHHFSTSPQESDSEPDLEKHDNTEADIAPTKEFYIPSEATSIHFLKSKLCVGCAKGFEVVDLQTLDTQSLLDQADTSHDFVSRKEFIKPIYIERIATEFLLCYSDFSFFVNRNGWRAKPEWRINWEGNPQSFAISPPYILAFENSFIEIRHLETAMLVHILTGKNIRMLHSSTREILYAYEDENGIDVIASLDFWGRPQSPLQERTGRISEVTELGEKA